jgi:hypothetical protein
MLNLEVAVLPMEPFDTVVRTRVKGAVYRDGALWGQLPKREIAEVDDILPIQHLSLVVVQKSKGQKVG